MATSLHGQTILIVEDEPFIALDMEQTLSSAGAQVISALHLAEAFEAAQNADISAVCSTSISVKATVPRFAKCWHGGKSPSSSTRATWTAAHLPCGSGLWWRSPLLGMSCWTASLERSSDHASATLLLDRR